MLLFLIYIQVKLPTHYIHWKYDIKNKHLKI